MTRSFRAHPSSLYEVREFVRQQSAVAGLAEDTTNELLLAVSEASANSVLHTNSPTLWVGWRDDRDCVEVEVRDWGVFKRRVRVPEVEGTGGHGIPLMMALVDEFGIREGTERNPGTTVRLVKCRDG